MLRECMARTFGSSRSHPLMSQTGVDKNSIKTGKNTHRGIDV
jgi:hypothetical protein